MVVISFMIILILPSFTSAEEDQSVSDTLHSETAVLMDGNTGQILFDKNGSKRMYPASITKIVTGIMAIEEGDLNDNVTIGENPPLVEGTRVYLREGETLKLKQLVQGLMINSGNDAGLAIAEHLSGDEESFAEAMNEFVHKKVFVKNTQFTNPHGLFDENHYTTALDMAKITKYAMENEAFKDIVGTKQVEWKSEDWDTVLINHNRLLWRYEEATGVKNGYVSEAGTTLVTSAEKNGRELISVTMKAGNSEDAYEDAELLLDYGFDQFETKVLHEGQTFTASKAMETFYVPKNISISIKKGEEQLSTTMSTDGKLQIFGAENRLIYERYLPSMQTSKKKKSLQEDESSHSSEVDRWPQDFWMAWPDVGKMFGKWIFVD